MASGEEQQQDERHDFKEKIGNPKIICIMGGPCSGKNRVAMDLADEFGYHYISVG